jgi:hypothetical protein
MYDSVPILTNTMDGTLSVQNATHLCFCGIAVECAGIRGIVDASKVWLPLKLRARTTRRHSATPLPCIVTLFEVAQWMMIGDTS